MLGLAATVRHVVSDLGCEMNKRGMRRRGRQGVSTWAHGAVGVRQCLRRRLLAVLVGRFLLSGHLACDRISNPGIECGDNALQRCVRRAERTNQCNNEHDHERAETHRPRGVSPPLGRGLTRSCWSHFHRGKMFRDLR